ncbi:hypothetical protein KFS98_003536 [Salmonella enterica]|nr:hypothetical protein [Salmonella enterica]
MSVIKASDIKDLDAALIESLKSGNLTIEASDGSRFVAFPLKSLEGIQLNAPLHPTASDHPMKFQ